MKKMVDFLLDKIDFDKSYKTIFFVRVRESLTEGSKHG
jgi:hypothetical protein